MKKDHNLSVLRNSLVSLCLGCILILGGVIATPFKSQSQTIEFVSQKQIQLFASLFQRAKKINKQKIASWKSKLWICSMYGIRSQLQVEKGLQLYQFQLQEGKVLNQGVHPVHEYKINKDGLMGYDRGLFDEVRQLPQGGLVARLSFRSNYVTSSHNQSPILSYSHCQPVGSSNSTSPSTVHSKAISG